MAFKTGKQGFGGGRVRSPVHQGPTHLKVDGPGAAVQPHPKRDEGETFFEEASHVVCGLGPGRPRTAHFQVRMRCNLGINPCLLVVGQGAKRHGKES